MSYGRGHCTGRKRERPGARDWYAAQEEANIQAVEATWQPRPIAEHCHATRKSDGQKGLAHLRQDGMIALYPQHLGGLNYVCRPGECPLTAYCDHAGHIVPA